MRRLISATLFSLLVVPCAFAQTQETINVHVVEVPVTVVGSDGNPVRGLTAKNFEIDDGDEKRAITGFDAIGDESLHSAARRNLLLLFDLTFTSPEDLLRAQEAARTLVAKSLEPRDLAAIGTIEAEKGFRLLTSFTTDRELLLTAIAAPDRYESSDPLRLAAMRPAEEYALQSGQIAERSRRSDGRERVERQIGVLGELAEALRAVKGRKQVVLLSHGFDPRLVATRDIRDTRPPNFETEAVHKGLKDEGPMTPRSETRAKTGGSAPERLRIGSSTGLALVDQMAQLFRGSDVILNAIDTGGLHVDVSVGAVVNFSGSLNLLSRPTGGRLFKLSNALADEFARAMRAQDAGYILAFQAPAPGSGKSHDLKVKLVDGPERTRVLARAAWYDGGAQTPTERTLTDADIVMNDIAQSDLRVSAWAASFPGSERLAQVPVLLELDGPGLLKGAAKGNAADARIYIYAFDENGVVRDRLFQKITLDLANVRERLARYGVKYYGTLALPAGTYAIRTLVTAGDSDLRGFARVDIVVPKAQQLALGRPLFIEEGQRPMWVLVKGISHDTSESYPFEIGGQRFVPATRATTDSRRFTLLVWNAGADELTWQTNPSATLLGHVDIGNATKLLFQLDKIDPGAGTLDIAVRKKGTAEAMKLSVPILR